MGNNKYNVIKFLEEEYTNIAKLKTPERKGFTVVEWGGTILD